MGGSRSASHFDRALRSVDRFPVTGHAFPPVILFCAGRSAMLTLDLPRNEALASKPAFGRVTAVNAIRGLPEAARVAR
jgi:hypothetical protein